MTGRIAKLCAAVTGFTLIAVFCAGATARAQLAREVPRITFHAVSELVPPPGASTALIGGAPARPADWPASFYSSHGSSACTSALVGPRALLTAAHCVAAQSAAAVVYKGETYTAKCSFSGAYNPDDPLGVTADWALCLLDRPLTGAQMLYERVNVNPALVRSGQDLVLTGFGCTAANLTGGNDGIFRTATAPVRELPNATSHDITVKGRAGEPTICPGDSGGGAYLASADLKKRIQVSVNSRTSVVSTPSGPLAIGESFLSSLSVAPAQTFLESWITATGQDICGVSPMASACRQTP